MSMLNHADEWAVEGKMERKHGKHWEAIVHPQEETVCLQCPYQHRPRSEEPCRLCDDNEDRDPCLTCPGHKAHSDTEPCEFEDGSACEHCRIGGTVPQAEALARWMAGEPDAG